MLFSKEAKRVFDRRCDQARRLGKVPWDQEFRLKKVLAPAKGEGMVALFPVDAQGRRLTALGPSEYGRLTLCG